MMDRAEFRPASHPALLSTILSNDPIHVGVSGESVYSTVSRLKDVTQGMTSQPEARGGAL